MKSMLMQQFLRKERERMKRYSKWDNGKEAEWIIWVLFRPEKKLFSFHWLNCLLLFSVSKSYFCFLASDCSITHFDTLWIRNLFLWDEMIAISLRHNSECNVTQLIKTTHMNVVNILILTRCSDCWLKWSVTLTSAFAAPHSPSTRFFMAIFRLEMLTGGKKPKIRRKRKRKKSTGTSCWLVTKQAFDRFFHLEHALRILYALLTIHSPVAETNWSV